MSRSWSYRGQNNPKQPTSLPKTYQQHSSQCGENNSPSWTTKPSGKTYTDHTGEENTDSQPACEGNFQQTFGIRMENMLDTTLWKREWHPNCFPPPGCVRPTEKKLVPRNFSDYCPHVRMNRQGKEWRSGESGMRGVVILLRIVRFNPLVECACGRGLTVLPHSAPSHNCLNYSTKH